MRGIGSTNTTNYHTNAVNNAQKSLSKISTGINITNSADNVANTLIASNMKTAADSFGSAMKNVNSGVAMMQIADGALSEYSDILNSIKSKTIQASNDTNSQSSREALQADIDQLVSQADSIATNTSYNGRSLLSGEPGLVIHSGESEGDTLQTPSVDAQVASLGLNTIDVSNSANAQASLTQIDAALENLNQQRSKIGSSQNALVSTFSSLSESRINQSASLSQVADLDFAKESANFNKENLLTQVSAYTASQNNTVQSNVLRLLQ